jgi:hypothetical protein
MGGASNSPSGYVKQFANLKLVIEITGIIPHSKMVDLEKQLTA